MRLISSRMTDASVTPSPPPPYSSRNQRREPAGLGQRLDERLGIARALVQSLPVVAAEPGAQLAHGAAILLELPCARVDVSHLLPSPSARHVLAIAHLC